MPICDIAATIEGEDLDRFEALVGRAQPPPTASPTPARSSEPARQDTPGLGRSIITATIPMVSVVFVAVTAGLAFTGTSLASSLGIGIFTALWGGGGFGTMTGGVLYTHLLDEPATYRSPVGTAQDLSPAQLPPWPSWTPARGPR